MSGFEQDPRPRFWAPTRTSSSTKDRSFTDHRDALAKGKRSGVVAASPYLSSEAMIASRQLGRCVHQRRRSRNGRQSHGTGQNTEVGSLDHCCIQSLWPGRCKVASCRVLRSAVPTAKMVAVRQAMDRRTAARCPLSAGSRGECWSAQKPDGGVVSDGGGRDAQGSDSGPAKPKIQAAQSAAGHRHRSRAGAKPADFRR